jgi:predicted AAA+ superfamily ATPase
MDDRILNAVRQKLGDAVSSPFPPLTPREAQAPTTKGKARAVIGMRRAGKTTFLFQCLGDRLARGVERRRLVYFNFEDERIAGLDATDLGVILDEYYREHPAYRGQQVVTWCFDEVQVVSGWERFVRRVLDSEHVEVFLSGSSANMLSRELATSMRGRALETVITPFSFREFARFRGATLPMTNLLSAAEESAWLAQLDDYLDIGGFPEAARPDMDAERAGMLQGYVDAVLFRDIAERHGIGNLVAMRAFVRLLLRQPATSLSVNKTHQDFKSRGISVSKETLLALLGHLEDAFLVFTVPIASRSERRRQINPRKLYLADHGLAVAFQPQPGADRGHHIENVVACELKRRCRDLAFVRTESGLEVDFLAIAQDGSEQLIQVAEDIGDVNTFEREVRSLLEAGAEHPHARKVLIANRPAPRNSTMPRDVEFVPLLRWLLSPSVA